MASILRNKVDGGFDYQRPSSAPPAEALPSQEEEVAVDNRADPRLDPNYAAYYYYYSRFDPRLPPPLYAPGQSWQAGAMGGNSKPSNQWNQQQQAPVPPQMGMKQMWEQEEGRNMARKALVDMIQDDFPRTPSPLLGARRAMEAEDDHLAHAMRFVNMRDEIAHNQPPPQISYASRLSSPGARSANGSPNQRSKDMFALPPSTKDIFGWGRDEMLGIQRPKSVATPSFNAASKLLGGEPFAGPKRNNMSTPPPPGFGRPSSIKPTHSPAVSDSMKVRSPLLEEFRTNKTRKFELKDIAGFMIEFSGDQHGSRFIQQKLETATVEEKQLVFNEIQPQGLALMTDVFGNYVIQKFFEYGTPQQKAQLAGLMKGHVLSLSTQMYGCRVMQKALEHVHVDQQTQLVKELDGHILTCVKDQNGNHVIQKCIERVPPDLIGFIIGSFSNQVYSLATHPYGCRVIQRLFEHCNEEQIKPLLDEIHRYILNLAQDQYGNYVVQHILEKGYGDDRSKIIDRLTPHMFAFSRHKFASNVIEKCVLYGTHPQRKRVVDDLCLNCKDTSSPLFQMMKDQYANYVVQKMIDRLEKDLRDALLEKIKPLIPALKKFSYGKHIVNKVEKAMGPL